MHWQNYKWDYQEKDTITYVVQRSQGTDTLRKHAYSNILNFFQPKKEIFQIKNKILLKTYIVGTR